eukprot:scaffold174_cov99-Isochrysis_galbana.AAC.3
MRARPCHHDVGAVGIGHLADGVREDAAGRDNLARRVGVGVSTGGISTALGEMTWKESTGASARVGRKALARDQHTQGVVALCERECTMAYTNIPAWWVGVRDFVCEDVAHFGSGDFVLGRAECASREQAHHLRGRATGSTAGGVFGWLGQGPGGAGGCGRTQPAAAMGGKPLEALGKRDVRMRACAAASRSAQPQRIRAKHASRSTTPKSNPSAHQPPPSARSDSTAAPRLSRPDPPLPSSPLPLTSVWLATAAPSCAAVSAMCTFMRVSFCCPSLKTSAPLSLIPEGRG